MEVKDHSSFSEEKEEKQKHTFIQNKQTSFFFQSER